MSRRRNVLWIVSDHQVHATRPPGADFYPLQHALASRGIEFTRACSVLPVCSPARASMLTGLYPHAHGLTENDGRFGGREGLDSSDWMLHRPLLDHGYRCGWFGKWHVDNRNSAQAYGFEGFSLPGYGYPYATSAYRDYLERSGLDEPIARIVIPGESGIAAGSELPLAQQKSWFDYESGVAELVGSARTHEAFFVADLARRWLRANNGSPFFLRVDTWGPHPPYFLAEPYASGIGANDFDLPPNFDLTLAERPDHHRNYRDYWQQTLGLDRSQWQRMYVAALAHAMLVESALVQLLDAVDLDETLVVFNSDHGDAIGSNGGIANKGGLLAEATVKIPLYVAGAGLPGGESRDELISQLDLVPTLLDFCGVDTDQRLHGDSLWPLLNSNNDAQWRRGLMLQHYGLHDRIVQRAWYQDDFKYVLQQDGFEECYCLPDDPGEAINLALQSENRDLVDGLRQSLRVAMERYHDNFRPDDP